jgi:hypothetical protein
MVPRRGSPDDGVWRRERGFIAARRTRAAVADRAGAENGE